MNPYYSHQKYLTEELSKLDYTNPALVLEFGTGDGSASILQSFALKYPNLRIESYEDNFNWMQNTYIKYSADNYHFHHVDSWDSFFEREVFNEVYDLVFVDSSPWESRIKAIDAVKNRTKVFMIHDYNYYNRGVMEDLYCVTEGSFFYDRYGKDFILQCKIDCPDYLEYPGTLIMKKRL